MTQQLNEAEIIHMYSVENLSTKEIAQKFGTYPNKINRILKRNNIPLKTHADAQRIAISSGRIQHPTKGKKHSESVKAKISAASYNRWQQMSEEDRKKISDSAKQQWLDMSEEERDEFRKLAAVGVRKAANEGSKIEKILLEKLRDAGYNVLFHTKHLMAGTELELDFYIPALNTVIEIDGPAHFFPIWGEDILQKKIKGDSQKGGLIISQGAVLIRVKYLCKNTSTYVANSLFEQLDAELQRIKTQFPDKGRRLIELEVKV